MGSCIQNCNLKSALKFKYAIDRSAYPNNYVAFHIEVNLKPKFYSPTASYSNEQLFTVSSETNIIPEYYPTGDCSGSECYGTLV